MGKYGQVIGSCKQRNELLGCIKWGS